MPGYAQDQGPTHFFINPGTVLPPAVLVGGQTMSCAGRGVISVTWNRTKTQERPFHSRIHVKEES